MAAEAGARHTSEMHTAVQAGVKADVHCTSLTTVLPIAGYKQALGYRFPPNVANLSLAQSYYLVKDSCDLGLSGAKSQLWMSAAAQEAMLQVKLISMTIHDVIRPQQQLIQQCQTQCVVQQIWAQSTGQSELHGQSETNLLMRCVITDLYKYVSEISGSCWVYARCMTC